MWFSGLTKMTKRMLIGIADNIITVEHTPTMGGISECNTDDEDSILKKRQDING